MATMVDMWGASAHCEVCDEVCDEIELADDGSGREVCEHCRDIQAKLSESGEASDG